MTTFKSLVIMAVLPVSEGYLFVGFLPAVEATGAYDQGFISNGLALHTNNRCDNNNNSYMAFVFKDVEFNSYGGKQ